MILSEQAAKDRFYASFLMILDFYGFSLEDKHLGRFGRGADWREKYKYINSSIQNYRNLTRIIKSLGLLGLEKYQHGLVSFLLKETLLDGELECGKGLCLEDWIRSVKSPDERSDLFKMAAVYQRRRTNGCLFAVASCSSV